MQVWVYLSIICITRAFKYLSTWFSKLPLVLTIIIISLLAMEYQEYSEVFGYTFFCIFRKYQWAHIYSIELHIYGSREAVDARVCIPHCTQITDNSSAIFAMWLQPPNFPSLLSLETVHRLIWWWIEKCSRLADHRQISGHRDVQSASPSLHHLKMWSWHNVAELRGSRYV